MDLGVFALVRAADMQAPDTAQSTNAYEQLVDAGVFWFHEAKFYLTSSGNIVDIVRYICIVHWEKEWTADMNQHIDTVRHFNRYYTNVLGLLGQHILTSDYSLAEVRVLYEIRNFKQCTPKMLMQTLCMDSGYLSRILKRFQQVGLIDKQKSPDDGRSQVFRLSKSGKREIKMLVMRQNAEIHKLLEPLTQTAQAELVGHMAAIENILKRCE